MPLEASPQVSDQLAGLPAGVRRISLSPIDVDAVSDLAGSVVGRTLSDRDVRDLHARTGGNPFFVHEVARLLLAHGPSGALRVPPGVEEVLRRRVARLGQPCATLLAAAAVAAEGAEDRVETDLLAAMSDRPEAAVPPLLDEAVAARLLDRRPGAARAPPLPARADPRGAGAGPARGRARPAARPCRGGAGGSSRHVRGAARASLVPRGG